MKTYMREYVAHGMLLNYYHCNMDRKKKQVDYKTEKVQAKYSVGENDPEEILHVEQIVTK